jgi:hypothetical protein
MVNKESEKQLHSSSSLTFQTGHDTTTNDRLSPHERIASTDNLFPLLSYIKKRTFSSKYHPLSEL